jgi:hypothetical protein
MSDGIGAIERGGFNFRGARGGARPQQQRPQQQQRRPGTTVVNAFPYYSTVRYQAAITTVGAVTTYRIAAGSERRAFGYGIGDPLSAAGFGTSAPSANTLHTNLINRAQTNAGEEVVIHGISAYLSAESDPLLAAMLFERTSLVISLNGDQQQFRLGRLAFIPGGGGLHGAGHTSLQRPGQSDQTRLFSVATNGLPGRENFYPLPFPIKWASAGRPDSNLVLVSKVEADVVLAATARAADTGVEAWTPPSTEGDLGTYVDVVFKFITETRAARSVNA